MKYDLAKDLIITLGVSKRSLSIIRLWIKDRGINRISDLMRYGKKYSESIDNARNDLWNYATKEVSR
jgi:hypothetical protein